MAAQNIGIIYSTAQQVIRKTIDPRWIGWDRTGKTTTDPFFRVPDPNAHDDLLLPHKAKMVAGESWAIVPVDAYDTHNHPLQTHQYLGLAGIPGVTDRCIVHANALVRAIIHADPAIDSHPSGKVAFDTTGKAVIGNAVVNGVAVVAESPLLSTEEAP